MSPTTALRGHTESAPRMQPGRPTQLSTFAERRISSQGKDGTSVRFESNAHSYQPQSTFGVPQIRRSRSPMDDNDNHIGDSDFFNPGSFASMLYHPNNYDDPQSQSTDRQAQWHTHISPTYYTSINDDLLTQFINNIKHQQAVRKLKLKQVVNLLQTDYAVDKYQNLDLYDDETDGVDEYVADEELSDRYRTHRPASDAKRHLDHQDHYSPPLRPSRSLATADPYLPSREPSHPSDNIPVLRTLSVTPSLTNARLARRMALQTALLSFVEHSGSGATSAKCPTEDKGTDRVEVMEKENWHHFHYSNSVDATSTNLDFLLGFDQEKGDLAAKTHTGRADSGSRVLAHNLSSGIQLKVPDDMSKPERQVESLVTPASKSLTEVSRPLVSVTPVNPPEFTPTPSKLQRRDASDKDVDTQDSCSGGSTPDSNDDHDSNYCYDDSISLEYNTDPEIADTKLAPAENTASGAPIKGPTGREQRLQALQEYKRELLELENMMKCVRPTKLLPPSHHDSQASKQPQWWYNEELQVEDTRCGGAIINDENSGFAVGELTENELLGFDEENDGGSYEAMPPAATASTGSTSAARSLSSLPLRTSTTTGFKAVPELLAPKQVYEKYPFSTPSSLSRTSVPLIPPASSAVVTPLPTTARTTAESETSHEMLPNKSKVFTLSGTPKPQQKWETETIRDTGHLEPTKMKMRRPVSIEADELDYNAVTRGTTAAHPNSSSIEVIVVDREYDSERHGGVNGQRMGILGRSTEYFIDR
jgi:hypothetical protein